MAGDGGRRDGSSFGSRAPGRWSSRGRRWSHCDRACRAGTPATEELKKTKPLLRDTSAHMHRWRKALRFGTADL